MWRRISLFENFKYLFNTAVKKLIIPFFCLMLAASILRLWHLENPDINPDEDHYIQDAVRLSHKDPFVSIRYHTFRHGEPSIGHPYLVQIIGAKIFTIFGYSNFTARLPEALAGISTVAILFLFNKAIGGRVAFMSALLLATIPFTVRYNRDAHLDSFFAFFTTLTALCIWRYNFGRNFIWLIAGGIAVGLAISTKLDGIIALILALSLLLLSQIYSSSPTKLKIKGLLNNTIVILITSSTIAFLLNDPTSYLGAIIKPSDPNYSLRSVSFWMNSIRDYKFWEQVAFYLLTPAVIFSWLASFVYIIKRNDYTSRFLLVWQLVLFPILVFHRPSLSGQYGLLPVVPPMLISTAFVINIIFKRRSLLLLVILIASALPFTRLYGLYVRPLPYHQGKTVWTRTINDSFYLNIIENVNELAPKNGKVYLLPQTYYPLVSLRPDLSWTYSDIKESDVFIVDKAQLVKPVKGNILYFGESSAFQDGESLTRFIFVRRFNQKTGI